MYIKVNGKTTNHMDRENFIYPMGIILKVFLTKVKVKVKVE
jgi:hypothetical protein